MLHYFFSNHVPYSNSPYIILRPCQTNYTFFPYKLLILALYCSIIPFCTPYSLDLGQGIQEWIK